MATMLGQDSRGVTGQQVKPLYVDHSDVYLENHKLGEALIIDLEFLQRSQYRQLILRQAEIQKFKKALLLFSKPSEQHLPQDMEKQGRQRKVSRVEKNDRLLSAQGQTKSDTLEQLKSANSSNSTSTTKKSVTSISVKMPRIDVQAVTDDSDDGDSHVGQFRSRATSSVSRGRKISNITGRSSTANSQSPFTSQKPEINSLMRKLKLQQYPKEWYTSVLPATDVEVRRRTKTPQTQIKDPRRRLKSSTTIGDAAKIYGRSKTAQSRVSRKSTKPKVGGYIPTAVTVTTVFCHDPARSKSKKQLMKLSEQEREDALNGKVTEALRRRREDSRLKREMMEAKVKEFLLSLEEMDKERKKDTYLF